MMQSNNREYIGRNEFWTPSTIGLTQSMIDASINNISIKDNSSELFTVENNKLKSNIPMICDEPTESNEVANKEYIDSNYLKISTAETNYATKDNYIDDISNLTSDVFDIKRDLQNKYCTKMEMNMINENLKSDMNLRLKRSDAESTYAKKTDISGLATISTTSFSVVTSAANKITITDLPSRGTGSRVEIPIPSSVTGNTKIVFIDFVISCPLIDVKAMLDILSCCLNTKDGSNSTDYRMGINFTGLRTTSDNLSRMFSVREIFTGDISKLYLHFYFNDFTSKYGNNELWISSTSIIQKNLNVKIVSF